MNCNISIHDVRPNNLHKIIKIINLLFDKYNIQKITLLVIPGLNWNNKQIKILKTLQEKKGIELAAHGWYHKSNSIKTIYHYIHSKLISADSAEHLSRSKPSIIKLLNDSHLWFINQGLNSPTLYVPPAGALGDIDEEDLSALPFNEFEMISGIFINNKFIFITLIGFKTKTYFKFIIVKVLNFINYLSYNFFGLIRIAIHPDDFNLLLKHDIDKYLRKITANFSFSELKIK